MTERETARRVAIRLGAGGKLYCADWPVEARGVSVGGPRVAPRRLIVRVPPGPVDSNTVFRIRFHGSTSGRSISHEIILGGKWDRWGVYAVARRMVEEALGREL